MPAIQLTIGMLLGVLIGVLAWRAGALNRSGAWAAAISGGLIFGLGGAPWAVLLLTFFVSSSVLSKLFASRKADLSEKFAKGSQRDWGQVIANGGFGAILAIVYATVPDVEWPWFTFAGAMAAVNADTWATELGVLNPSPPRLITSWKVVERGASGGVSPLGSLAAAAGAGLIAVLAAVLSNENALTIFAAVLFGGLAGAFFDSVLGATVQAIYACTVCEKETERHPYHLCGTKTHHLRGWRWLNNDMVNFLASLCGGMVVVGLLVVLT